MKVWKYIKNEEGSATYVMVIGLMMLAVFLSFVFFDMLSTYATKSNSQTASDAAALGAAKEIRNQYEERLQEELEEYIGELDDDIEEALDDIDDDDDLEEEREDLYEDLELPDEIIDVIEGEDDELSINVVEALLFFEDDDQEPIFEAMCDQVSSAQSEIEDTARHYAEQNGAESDIVIEFPHDERFVVMVESETETSFATVEESQLDSSARHMETLAASNVTLPSELEYDANYCG